MPRPGFRFDSGNWREDDFHWKMRIRPRHRHTALGGKEQCIRLATGFFGGRLAEIFRDSRPPWQVSDNEMDVARPVSMALRNKVNFTNHATKLSQNNYTTGFRHFSYNEHPYSVIFKSIFHEKLLQNSGIWRGNRVLSFSAFTLGMRGIW